MLDIWIAFVTGLTAGGLSCMAVQGGLLASSLASQLEEQVRDRPVTKAAGPRLATPIMIFLVAKLVAYTLLGFLLGALGSTLSLTPMTRALLQFAIGIFMIGNALRILNVHPIFRYFSIETPAPLRRFIRKSSKGGTLLATPVLLGALTVFIPCGIAQSMMAVALGTANPFAGAAILFSFTLGTTPVFFALSYTAARMGAALEKNFMRLVAVVLLLLGVFAIDTGLNLAGSPVSLTSTLQSVIPVSSSSEVVPATNSNAVGTELILYAKDNGYTPRNLSALAEQAIQLKVITQNTTSCALAFTIPELGVAKDLPVTGQVIIPIPAQPKGKVMRFSCSMGMYTGQIVFN